MSAPARVGAFASARATSARLHARAAKVIPGGVTHDGRHATPFPVYYTRAAGARKWDVDGHEYIDYWMGHGALLLGHNPPEVVAAVQAQLERGTHLGGCHELEVRWAELIAQLVPSAERVQFTSSGTEATLLAIRLARAAAGRDKIVRFHGHFHGWHDYAIRGNRPPFHLPTSSGVPAAVLDTVIALPADLDAVNAAIAAGDSAGVILEPLGGTQGKAPLPTGFLPGLREITRRAGVVLIFDEVVTGFRVHPGGAQALTGIKPDLTALGKIVAGGLPGGAVAGRADLLRPLDFTEDPAWNRRHRVAHPGTFNANPLTAAAGVAMLTIVADGRPQRLAAEVAHQLRSALNDVLDRRGVAGCVYGESSIVHIFLGEATAGRGREAIRAIGPDRLLEGLGAWGPSLRRELLLRGVDPMGPTLMVSTAHGAREIEGTILAFKGAVDALAAAGVV